MSDKHEHAAAFASAKARLIKEGELYRLGVQHSKHMVVQALHPEVLLHGAIDMAVGAVQARVTGLFAAGGLGSGGGGGGGGIAGMLAGLNYRALMPLAITAISFIKKRGMVKQAAAATAVAAAAGTWLYRRKQQTRTLRY